MLSEAFDKLEMARKLPKVSGEAQIDLLITEPGESEIIRVLSVSSAAEVDACDAGNELSAVGKVTATVVFERADGSIESAKATSTFHVKKEGTASKAFAKATINDTKVQSVSSDSVKMTQIVSVDFYAIQESEVTMLAGGNENTYVKTDWVKAYSMLATSKEDLSEDINMESRLPLKKILSISTDSVIKNIASSQNLATVEGEIFAEVLAITEEENPRFITISKNQNFSTQVAINGLCQNCDIDAMLTVKASEVSSEINGKEVVVICPMTFAYTALRPNEKTAVTDLYSTANILDIKHEKAPYCAIIKRETFSAKVEGNLSLSAEEPRMDKFLAVSGSSIHILSANFSDGMLEITGIAKTSVIYLNDEEGRTNSVEVEVPFTTKQWMDIETNAQFHVNAILSDVDITIKRGREIFFDAKISGTVTLSREEFVTYICEVGSAGEVPKNDAQIELFFTNPNQTFWDVAKQTYICEDILRKQNSAIIEPFNGTEKLVVYHQKMAK